MVHPTWAIFGADVLWREAHVTALQRIADPARRQHYANKIRTLGVRLSQCTTADADNGPAGCLFLRFPKLHRVILCAANADERQQRDEDDICDACAAFCSWLPSSVTAVDIEEHAELAHLLLLPYLARHAGLTALELSSRRFNILGGHVDALSAVAESQPLFAELRSLDASVVASSMTRAVALLPRSSMRRLKLRVFTADPLLHWPVTAPVATRLPELCSLHLTCVGSRLSNADIAALQALRRLRELAVDNDAPERLVFGYVFAPDFGDAELAQLLASLAQLRRFKWVVMDKRSPRAFRVVGECCPLLEELTLSGECEAEALEDATGAVFPRLKTLDIDGFREVQPHEGKHTR